MFYHRQPATGVPGAVICSEGYRRMQELGSKRRETTIYTGSVRRKITAPYVQCGVDSILRPTLFVVVHISRRKDKEDHLKISLQERTQNKSTTTQPLKLNHEMLGALSMRDP